MALKDVKDVYFTFVITIIFISVHCIVYVGLILWPSFFLKEHRQFQCKILLCFVCFYNVIVLSSGFAVLAWICLLFLFPWLIGCLVFLLLFYWMKSFFLSLKFRKSILTSFWPFCFGWTMSNSNRTIYSPVFLPCWIINQCIWELGVSLFFMYDSSLIMYVKMPQTLDWSMYRILFFSYTWRVCLSFLLRVWLRKFWFCVIVCFGLEHFNVSMVRWTC